MFSRELTNDYGTYSIKGKSTALLKGVFDKNFIELSIVDPTTITYKVFDSSNINFTIKVGNSTYIPSHLFSDLKKAYEEGNPYYTVKDIITVELDLAKTLSYIDGKYGAKVETNTITYNGTSITVANPSGSVSGSTTTIQVNANPVKGQSTRFGLAGVTEVKYQFYVDNNPNIPNDDNIIKHILFLFEDTTIRISGTSTVLPYQLNDASQSVILQNLPASTDVVKPVTTRVTNLDDYLRDVVRTN
jgi:hypothetical protein